MIERYRGQPLPIRVQFPSDPLVPYGATYGDITEIRMNLKRCPGNDDDDQYLEKSSLNAGEVTLDQGTHTFVMQLNTDDYTQLYKGEYVLTLNVSIAAQPDFIELDLEDRTVKITEDRNRA